MRIRQTSGLALAIAVGLIATLVSWGQEPPEAVPAEGRSAHFEAVASQLQLGGQLFGYIDVDGDLGKLAKLIHSQFGDTADGLPPHLKALDVEHVLSDLGLGGIKAMGMSASAAGEQTHSRAFLYVPEERQGLLQVFGGAAGPFTALSLAPADTDLLVEQTLDLRAAFQVVDKMMAHFGGESAHAEFAAMTAEEDDSFGLSIAQLFGRLNTRLTIVGRVDPDKPLAIPDLGFAWPSFDLLIAVDDMGWLHEKIVTTMKAEASADELAAMLVTGDGFVKITLPAMPDAETPVLRPVFYHDLASKRIYLASTPAFLDLCLSDGNAKLVDTADYKAAVAGLPSAGNGLYFGSPELRRSARTVLQEIISMPAEGPFAAFAEENPAGDTIAVSLAMMLVPEQATVIANQADCILISSNSRVSLQSALKAAREMARDKAKADKAAKAKEAARVAAAEAARAEQVAAAVAAQAEAGEARTVPVIGMELLPIPAGSFVMGSPKDEARRVGNESQHAVTISRMFWLGRYEVTQGEWQSVMGSNPSEFTALGKDAPVEKVSWDDVQSFCGKLNAATEGSRPAGYVYCLPTEAEWEYACRAGTTGAYAGDFAAMTWYLHNSLRPRRTHKVGEKSANAWGLHDMHGNVNEWCWDRYADYPAGSVSDPGGPSSSRYPNRVMRGGSFNGYAWYCRAAYRSKKWQSHGDSPLGFRLALAPGRERVERAEVAVAAITAVAERVAVAVAAQAGAGEARTVPGIGIELVAIPAGSFVMGSPRGEDGRERNESQRAVTISRVFWLGKYEVTQGEWQSVMGSNPSYFAKVGKNAPVERVSWDDAQSFCGKLNASTEGSRPAGYAYCLPTEAEWEYACRAGTTGAWAGDFAAMAWSGHHTQEVGEKFANAWGLHDMHGNALEWCSDRYADYPAGSVTDPVGASSGQDRVCRGGSSIDPARKCRAAYRISYPPGSRSSTLGFRLALASGRERVERVEAAATGRVAVIAGEAERVAVLWRRRRELVRRGRCRVSASSWWRYPLAAS